MPSLTESVRATVWRRQGWRGQLAWLALQPAAALFATGVALRNLAYRLGVLRARTGQIPVISVGNLSVGGTGKTPMTLWLARELHQRGRRVAIVLRGYAGNARTVTIVARGGGPEATVDAVGDEAVMLAKSFAGVVVTARQRSQGVEAAARLGCDLALLDDGFQHRALARDFDLVLIGNQQGARLPAGPMREGWGALDRADAVAWVDKGAVAAEGPNESRIPVSLPSFKVKMETTALIESDAGRWQELPLTRLSGAAVALVAAIADPQPFYRAVREWDPHVVEVFEFPDHHRYSSEDWQRINREARDAELIVTTEKDLVKLEQFPFARGKLVALRVTPCVDDSERLLRMIEEKIKS